MIKIIDAHTHVQMMESAQQDAVIQRALGAGIGMINAGADEKSSRDAITLAHHYEHVWATVGYHPQEVSKIPTDTDWTRTFTEFKKSALDEKVVGIGECGLEYFKLDPNHEEKIKKAQRELFEMHIQIAHEIEKPLVIHCREAFTDLVQILGARKELLLRDAGVVHFFTGTLENAKELLELGFSFTFGGLITINRSFDEILRYIPLNRILVETDAPWVAPKSHRGETNEPFYITETVLELAWIKEVSVEECEKILLENTKRVFRLVVNDE